MIPKLFLALRKPWTTPRRAPKMTRGRPDNASDVSKMRIFRSPLKASACSLIIIAFSCGAMLGQAIESDSAGAPRNGNYFSISPGTSISASTSSKRKTPTRASKRLAPEAIISDIDNALELIRRFHVDGKRLPPSYLTEFGTNGMLNSLDPHSRFLGHDEFQELLGQHENEYAGIGVSIQTFIRNDSAETYIIAAIDASPAGRASLAFGDRIVAVNGKQVQGLDSLVVREMLRGPIGSKMRLTVERNSTGVIEMLEVRREIIKYQSVKNSFMLADDVGYVDLSVGFGYSTPHEVSAAIRELVGMDMKSLVLDLRGNRGGLVESAVKTAEIFLPSGAAIVAERGRIAADNRFFASENVSPFLIPMVILVDGETASAAEILAGALQDNDRALIIGETTFGKGLVQEVILFENGSGMALTTARYYTPSGRSIQREYSDGHLYDYFRGANRGTAIDAPGFATKTLTGRTVFGGNGISPDIEVLSETASPEESQFYPDAFFFAKNYAALQEQNSAVPQIGVHFDCEAQFNSDASIEFRDILDQFHEYLADAGKTTPFPERSKGEDKSLSKQLKAFVMLGLCGKAPAEKMEILSDRLIWEAIRAMPEAETLSEKANHSRPRN